MGTASQSLPDETFLFVFKGAPLRVPPAADRPSGRACGSSGRSRPEPVGRPYAQEHLSRKNGSRWIGVDAASVRFSRTLSSACLGQGLTEPTDLGRPANTKVQ